MKRIKELNMWVGIKWLWFCVAIIGVLIVRSCANNFSTREIWSGSDDTYNYRIFAKGPIVFAEGWDSYVTVSFKKSGFIVYQCCFVINDDVAPPTGFRSARVEGGRVIITFGWNHAEWELPIEWEGGRHSLDEYANKGIAHRKTDKIQ